MRFPRLNKWRRIVVGAALAVLPAAGTAEAPKRFDESQWYLIGTGSYYLTAGAGDQVVLQGKADGQASDAQLWALVEDCRTGSYLVINKARGGCLGLAPDDTGSKVHLSTRPRCWTVQSVAGGDCDERGFCRQWNPERRITVIRAMPGKAALVASNDPGSPVVSLAQGTPSGWTFNPVGAIDEVPRLHSQGQVEKTEGRTDGKIYPFPGDMVFPFVFKALALPVTFTDLKGRTDYPEDLARDLLDDPVEGFFMSQSGGVMRLEVEVAEGWRFMPKPSTEYGFDSYDKHKMYIQDAANIYADHDLGDYDFIIFVAARGTALSNSASFTQAAGSGAFVESTGEELRLVVTLGDDVYHEGGGWRTVAHELGHLLGLPDLYPAVARFNADASWAGRWDLMSDSHRAVSFLGWHRYKLGWLRPFQVVYLPQTERTGRTFMLSPLEERCGTSMIVVPLDDDVQPSQVAVVEIAPPVRGRNGEPWPEEIAASVLAYRVDATKPTGSGGQASSNKSPDGPLAIYDDSRREFSHVWGLSFKAAAGDRNLRVAEAGKLIMIQLREQVYLGEDRVGRNVIVTVTPRNGAAAP